MKKSEFVKIDIGTSVDIVNLTRLQRVSCKHDSNDGTSRITIHVDGVSPIDSGWIKTPEAVKIMEELERRLNVKT